MSKLTPEQVKQDLLFEELMERDCDELSTIKYCNLVVYLHSRDLAIRNEAIRECIKLIQEEAEKTYTEGQCARDKIECILSSLLEKEEGDVTESKYDSETREWVTLKNGKEIKREKYNHQDGNFDNLCNFDWCRCKQ